MTDETCQLEVELRSGRIPVIGWFAYHHWLVVKRGERCDRWEVWQTPGNCAESWGHLHKNLMAPDAWIGHEPHGVVAVWRGGEAEGLADRIERSPDQYPWCHRYRYWPGPNSNTYAQWILGGSYRLGARAIGRRYAARRHRTTFRSE